MQAVIPLPNDNLINISDENIIWNIVLRVYPDVGPGTTLKTELLDVYEGWSQGDQKSTMAWSSPTTQAWAILAHMACSLRYFRRRAESSSDHRKKNQLCSFTMTMNQIMVLKDKMNREPLLWHTKAMAVLLFPIFQLVCSYLIRLG